jgi:uncharacterized BrkB/YihY/UPF0761 family membrane protein
MYIISLIVLVGAEFNALIYPRAVLTTKENDREPTAIARAK